jgi:hypothetical protein
MRENINQSIEEESAKQEIVRTLEKLNLSLEQKAWLILVVLGMKPATELVIGEGNDSQDTIKEVLSRAGLAYANRDDEYINKKDIYGKIPILAVISVARNRETLDELLKVSGKKDHGDYGRLMGYPETAVKAFVNKELLDKKDYPYMSDNIFPLKLSKDHWREEVEHLKSWNEAIKKYAPETYRQARGKD